MIVMPLLTLLGTLPVRSLAPWNQLTLSEVLGVGAFAGLAYVLAELPNSALKRKLGIAPGKLPEGVSLARKIPFLVLDQADSAIGCAIGYSTIFESPYFLERALPITGSALVLCAVLGPIIHLVVNLLLYAFGLRKNPV